MKAMKISQLLTLFYQIMVFNAILGTSQFSKIPYFSLITRIILLVLVLFGTILWFMKNRRINIAISAVILILMGMSLLVMKESNSQIAIMMLLYMMIINKDVEPRQFCRKYVESACVAILLVFILCFIGVFPNEYRYRITASGLTQYRYYFGFNYATAAPNFVFHISVAYLFYKQDDFNLKDAILVFIPSTFLYIYTDTRAAYFETLLLLFIFLLLKVIKSDWFKKMVGILSIWLMPILAGIELYIANNYSTSNTIYMIMDEVLSYRLSWVARALKEYPIGLLGNNITWAANGYNETSQLVDMFYLRCAIQYGLLFLAVVIIGFMGMGAYFRSRGNYFGCAVIIILALHSVTDPQLLEYSCVPLLNLLLIGYLYIFDVAKFKSKIKKRSQTNSYELNRFNNTVKKQ